MTQNNVFQMLAKQEMEKPERDLKRLQLKTLMDETKYKEQTRTDLAAMPQTTTTTLGSMAPPQQAFNPLASQMQPQASMDPTAQQGGSLASMGLNVNPMEQKKPLTLLEGFQREYNYHNSKGRTDLARQVHKDQFDYTIKVADYVDKLRQKPGGAENVTAWMKANPEISSVLGDPSTIKVNKEGVWYPVTKNDSNEIIPGKFWSYDGKGGINNHEVKPEAVQTFAPGVGIADGKGGYTVPVAKVDDHETWGDPYETSVGGKKAMVQKSSRGQLKPVIQDTSTTVKVTTGGSQGKAPAGYRWAADGNLEPIPGGPASTEGKGGGKILPAGVLGDIADMNRVKGVLKEAKDLLGTTEIKTGPVMGRLQAIGAKAGLAGDDFVNLQQKLQTAQNIMLKLRSGAAVTESEYARFLKEYPTPNDTPEVRDRKMLNTIEYASTLMDGKMTLYQEGGYRVPQSLKEGGQAPQAPAPARPGKKAARPPLSAIFGNKRR